MGRKKLGGGGGAREGEPAVMPGIFHVLRP